MEPAVVDALQRVMQPDGHVRQQAEQDLRAMETVPGMGRN